MTLKHFPWKDAFLNQQPNETILLILRRHWIVLAGHFFHLALFSIIPGIAAIIIYYTGWWEVFLDEPGYVIAVLVTSTYYVGLWLMYFHIFLDYRLDIWVVTDQRIVDIEQRGLFNRIVSELNILNVQDVTSEVQGKFGTFLDFGNIYVQTAGEQHRFIFSQVPKPQAVARIVMQAHETAMKMQVNVKTNA